jgi:hypothetical protein
MTFATWLDTFLSEKQIDKEEIFEVEAFDGSANLIPVGCLTDAMKCVSSKEQRALKTLLIKVDFQNGDVRRCLRHLAKAIALPSGFSRTA